MPRPLKPLKVDYVRSPNGYTSADVMFDRDNKKFFVEITPGDRDSRVESDLLADVKKLAREALARAQSYPPELRIRANEEASCLRLQQEEENCETDQSQREGFVFATPSRRGPPSRSSGSRPCSTFDQSPRRTQSQREGFVFTTASSGGLIRLTIKASEEASCLRLTELLPARAREGASFL